MKKSGKLLLFAFIILSLIIIGSTIYSCLNETGVLRTVFIISSVLTIIGWLLWWWLFAAKCPKCKKHFGRKYSHTITAPYKETIVEGAQGPIEYYFSCKHCNHHWKLFSI